MEKVSGSIQTVATDLKKAIKEIYHNARLLEDEGKAKFLNVTYNIFSISFFVISKFREKPLKFLLFIRPFVTASDESG
jgi:hypothetical protein